MKLDDWLEKLDARLDRVETNLGEHMRRSAAAEEANRLTRQELALMRSEIEPVKAHIAAWGGVAKALGILGGAAGLLAGVYNLYKLVGG